MLESMIGNHAIRDLRRLQAGDMRATCADVADLERAVGFAPRTPLGEGLRKFVDWYRNGYGFPA